MRARAKIVAAVLAVFVATSSCSVLPGGGTYRVSAIFPRAVALFPDSRVKVMGADVGSVKAVEIQGRSIRVEMAIRDDVPIRADAKASIVPFTLVGERNVVFSPVWKAGMPKLADGAVIPIDRTEIPVEPDEILTALRDLAKAIDPQAVGKLVTSAARSLRGRGKDLNTALEELGGIGSTLAGSDERLIEVARNIHTLASSLNSRERKLGAVVDSFSRVSKVLADEREQVAAFLDAMARLPREGQLLLASYQEEIPQSIATLAKVLMIVESNIDQVEQLVLAFPPNAELIRDIWRPSYGLGTLRINAGGSGRAALQRIYDALGLGEAPCIPTPDVPCAP